MPISRAAGYGGGSPQQLGRSSTVVRERIKGVSYHATDHKLLLDIETDQTVGSVKQGDIGELEIVNTGKHPVFAIFPSTKTWTKSGLI